MARRAVLVLGLLLAVFGVLAAAGLVTREVSRQFVDVGVGRGETRVEQPYPLWTSTFAIVAGVLMVAGATLLGRRRRALAAAEQRQQ